MYRIRHFGIVTTATVITMVYGLSLIAIFVPGILILQVMYLLAFPEGSGNIELVTEGVNAIIASVLVVWPSIAVATLVYNFLARRFGGIVVDVERVAPPTEQLTS